jgi:HSP20 family protein
MEARSARKGQSQPVAAVPAKVKPEHLLERLNQLRDAISRRAYELFESRGYQAGQSLSDWLRAEFELTTRVEFELTRENGNLLVTAEVPGFTEKEIQVSVAGCNLMVSGRKEPSEKTPEGEKAEKREFFFSVELPADVDAEKVDASLAYGVLKIKLPIVPTAEPTRVEVKVG